MKIVLSFIFVTLLSGCTIKSFESGRVKAIQSLGIDSTFRVRSREVVLNKDGAMSAIRYKKGKRNGTSLFFAPNGLLYAKVYYKNDSIQGSISYTPRLGGTK